MKKQIAALPFRRSKGRGIEVLVITSRRTRRLIIPKGWPMKGKADHQSAAIEADEEAGARGVIAETPIGSFVYEKQAEGGETRRIETEVFPLEVTELKHDWKEKHQRSRRWMTLGEATDELDDAELGALIRRWARLRGGGDPAGIRSPAGR